MQDWPRSRGSTRSSAQHEIDCGFDWVDGYLHLPHGDTEAKEVERLKRDAELAAELGFDATFVDQTPLRRDARRPRRRAGAGAPAPLPGGSRQGHRGRGRPHPRAHRRRASSPIDPLSVTANGHRITCGDIVIATHNPLVGRRRHHAAPCSSRRSSRSTPATSWRAGSAKGVVPDVLLWDTADPYRYFRVEPHRDHDVVIFGGEDHKTGQAADTAERYRRLERALDRVAPGVELTHRWSGQVIETPDGLPYIGATAEHQYAGTGYAGNGLTFGTLAGMMIADRILGRANPWTELFDPGRKAIRHGLWDYLKENSSYPYYLIRDRFAGAEGARCGR